MDCTNIFKEAIIAGRKLAVLDTGTVNNILLKVAEAAIINSDFIIEENKKDLALMDTSDPRYDRLLLNAGRLEGIASDIRNVAGLPSPLGQDSVKGDTSEWVENIQDISSFWCYRGDL